jgi:hypothetical protein
LSRPRPQPGSRPRGLFAHSLARSCSLDCELSRNWTPRDSWSRQDSDPSQMEAVSPSTPSLPPGAFNQGRIYNLQARNASKGAAFLIAEQGKLVTKVTLAGGFGFNGDQPLPRKMVKFALGSPPPTPGLWSPAKSLPLWLSPASPHTLKNSHVGGISFS